MKADNDNTDTWIELAEATANLVRYLESNSENHERDGERQTPGQRSEKENPEDRRKAIEHGLRQIERFENLYRRGDRARR